MFWCVFKLGVALHKGKRSRRLKARLFRRLMLAFASTCDEAPCEHTQPTLTTSTHTKT